IHPVGATMPIRRSVAVVRLVLPYLLVLPSIAFSQATSKSQNDPRPVAQAELRIGEVIVDGRLDEAAWNAAKPITELVQSTPDEGKAPSQRTEIRILYDASALYIGARMYDTAGAKGVRSALARRDQVMNGDNNLTSDRIAFVFDTYRDKESRSWFELNPDGVKGDHQNGDPSYDPVWEGASKIDSLGWTAEFRIPFSRFTTRGLMIRSGGCRSGARLIVAPSRTCGRSGAATSSAVRPISVRWKELRWNRSPVRRR